MSTRIARALVGAVVVLTIVAPGSSGAQRPGADSASKPAPPAGATVVRTRDGSTLIGTIADSTRDTVRLATRGGMLSIAREDIQEIRAIVPSRHPGGAYWPESPNATRLFFAPTGRMLKQGEGYFSDQYLFFLNVVGAVTSNFTLGGGMSVFPTDDVSQNLFYITPKVGLLRTERLHIAAGALLGTAGFFEDDNAFGIMYGVATYGSADNSVTAGAGLGFAGGELARKPAFMVGGESRVSARASLVTENYFFSGGEDITGIVSYGVRFFGEKLSVDLAFWNALGAEEVFFPGIPYVSFSVKF